MVVKCPRTNGGSRQVQEAGQLVVSVGRHLGSGLTPGVVRPCRVREVGPEHG